MTLKKCKKIISDQSGDYICHKGVRQTWGYTGNHLDVGRFKRFNMPDYWTIIDKYFFGRTLAIQLQNSSSQRRAHFSWVIIASVMTSFALRMNSFKIPNRNKNFFFSSSVQRMLCCTFGKFHFKRMLFIRHYFC